MEFKTIDDIVDFAIEKEVEAADFYETAAENEDVKSTAEVLKEYAAEERKHEMMLTNLKNNKTKISEYKFEKIQDIKRSDYLLDLEFQKGMSYMEIMRLAMKREEKAHSLYEKLAQAAENTEQVNVFTILAQEEAKHKNYFETMYDDYMAAQGD
ncbi:MAG: ferritin family protein [Deltaproteobacteria bacterium]|jgi:rubrerythrin|nr:ferritin family protein [Deltaproteobacteria bacterium]MBT4267778.1 ferritin family protein [Deltaproteobacteria bacterium]MBT4644574.1 ferritin family protein [Deltaproteobacteria bacterium]MBT6614953.1 ferritin family protein [Deltaproteobacteria bacterium]MBT7152662.1 ferritin family protein [Deltaproteobacteria bacterium]